MENIRYELKYCEGCGTLKLQPVKSKTSHCRVCEKMLARFRFPQAARAKMKEGLVGMLSFLMVEQRAEALVKAANVGRSQ